MAIEIVGKDSGAYKEITCRNCATRLKYTPSDEQRDCSTDYTGGKDYYSYIKCPCCWKQVTTKNY